MPAAKWNLMDHHALPSVGESQDLKQVGAKFLSCSLRQVELRGGKSDRVSLITVDTGAASYSICPTRGMGLWKGFSSGLELGWKSPVQGPVNPAFVPIFDPNGLGWLEGFDELMCRCGLQSSGAPVLDEKTHQLLYALHGRIANIPAHSVQASADPESGVIEVTGVVDETRFHFQKLRLSTTYRFTANESPVEVIDRVTNLSASPAEIQMLYHVNFGKPLLDAGARLVAAAETVVPRTAADGGAVAKNWDSYAAETPAFAEQVYFCKLYGNRSGDTVVVLKNAHGAQGVRMDFNVEQLPCFTLWKNTTAVADGCVTGLEPGTNFPNPRPFEGRHGRVVKLNGGESTEFRWKLTPLISQDQVKDAEAAVAQVLDDRSTQVEESPLAGWCSSVES